MAAAIEYPEDVLVYDDAYRSAGAVKVRARELCEAFQGIRDLPPEVLVQVRFTGGSSAMTGPAHQVLPQAYPRMAMDEGSFCSMDPDQLVGTKDYQGLPELVRELRGQAGFPWKKALVRLGIVSAVSVIVYAGWMAATR